MSAWLDHFYLIVDDAAWLERLPPQGVRLAQLRVKDRRTAADLRAQIRAARDLCQRHDARLVVNDHWRLKKAARMCISARAT